MTSLLLAAAAPPAGGAEISQIIIATSAAMLLTTALLVLGLGYRSGRVPILGWAASIGTRVTGLPAWAALPSGIAAVSLITAAFGLYWDVSLHIDNGRDPGPLANPSHYFILGGLFGILTAGWFAVVLTEGKPWRSAVPITRTWHAPAAGIAMMACASFALMGFPLDDVFHRMFGQDVTLWGPTHLMMLTGAATTLIAILALLTEGRAAAAELKEEAVPAGVTPERLAFLTGARMRAIRLVSACGGLLIGLSIYQGEFDYAVPQFRLLFHPVLIALAASTALVVARTIAGRGAALATVGFFIVVRGALTLIVGPLFGETVAHFPLFIAEALLVEGVALYVSPQARPYRFAIVSGALIGSVGVLAEWGWSHVWMPIPWPGHIVVQAIALSVPVAIGAAVIGSFIGSALRLRADIVATPRAWAAVAASAIAIGAVVGYLLPTTVPEARATVALTGVSPGPHRMVQATVRIDPPSAARDADWLSTIAWQGGGRVRVAALKQIGPGVYRTTQALPVYGDWKSVLRLHRGAVMASVPVYMPADSAIPVAGIPASAHFDRAFLADHKVLQRERKANVPEWLFGVGSLLVLGISLMLFTLLGWALVRIAIGGAPEEVVAAAPSTLRGVRPTARLA